MRDRKNLNERRGASAALAATLAGVAVLAGWPLSGLAGPVENVVDEATAPAGQAVKRLPAPTATAPEAVDRATREARERPAATPTPPVTRQEDPKTEPPLHGTNPHGQGTVAVVDVAPSPNRPQGGDPAGSDSGEEVVVGRARGEQRDDGSYRGHITIVALFGTEILGVDTEPGETEAGPLNAVQEGILTPLCDGSGNEICLSAVTADSTTTENGSSNRFSAAHATLGGAEGIDAGVSESNGNISDDGNCQTAHGDSSVASASVGGHAVADVAQSSTDSQACKGQAPTQSNSSRVLALGGTAVPLPASGCGDGTADTVTGIPTIAPVVCNADDTNGSQAAAPYGVRDALSVFVLDVAGTPLSKAVTAGSESRAQAPPPQCSDGEDNDGDGVADAADPGCLSGPGGTYNPNDDDETNQAAAQCSDGVDNDGDGVVDASDPGCHTDGDAGNAASYDPNDDSEADAGTRGAQRDEEEDRDVAGRKGAGGDGGRPACSNGTDDDGDGLVDRADPGCLSGPGGAYNPQDDSEADSRRELAALPFTGTDALMAAIGGLLLLAAGLLLRRRTGLRGI